MQILVFYCEGYSHWSLFAYSETIVLCLFIAMVALFSLYLFFNYLAEISPNIKLYQLYFFSFLQIIPVSPSPFHHLLLLLSNCPHWYFLKSLKLAVMMGVYACPEADLVGILPLLFY